MPIVYGAWAQGGTRCAFLLPLRRKKSLRSQSDTGFLQKQQRNSGVNCLTDAFSALFSSAFIEAFPEEKGEP
jgi:hypothetical protein